MSSAAGLKNTHAVGRRLVLELREALERLERLEDAGGVTASLAAEAQRKLGHLHTTTAALEREARAAHLHGGAGAGGELWLRKAQQLAEEAGALRAALERCTQRHSRAVAEERSRAELFHRVTAGADSSGAAAISSEFDAEAQAFGAAARSNRALEELFHSGGAVLAALVSQREGLKGAQRRALDVLHALGLSDSLLRATDRRQRADRVLVTACSLFTLAVFLLLLWLVRGRK